MNKKTELTIIKESETFITIWSNEDLEKATVLLSSLNTYLDGIIAEKEKVTKPMLLALKNERARFKPLEEKLESAISKIRNELSRYATAVEAEKIKISERIKEGKGNLSVEKGIERMEKIAVPDKVATENGSLQFRPKNTLVIEDSTLIPNIYMLPNEKSILEALEKGIEVKGCKLVVVQIPYNSRS